MELGYLKFRKELNLGSKNFVLCLKRERDTESERQDLRRITFYLWQRSETAESFSYRKIFHVLKKRSSSFKNQNWKELDKNKDHASDEIKEKEKTR